MSLTLFGILWILIVAYFFCTKRISMMFYLTIFSMVFQCNNIVLIGSIGVGPQLFTSFAFIIKSFLLIKTPRRQKTILFFLLSLFFFYLIINLIKNGIIGSKLMDMIQLFIYLICTYRIYKCGNLITEGTFLKFTTCLIKFMVVVSIIQYMATIGLIPRQLLTPLLFNDTSEYIYFHHPEIYQRVLGTFMEPSYCAAFLVGSFYYIFHLRKHVKQYKLLLFALFIEIILTRSSTGYGTFCIIGFAYFCTFMDRSLLKLTIPVVLVILVFFFVFKDSLLNEVIFNKVESESGLNRGYQDARAINTFVENPIYGKGYKEVRASSFATTILAELGLIGTAIYLIFILAIIWPIFKKGNYTDYNIAARLLLFAVFISQLVAIPDIQFSVFWLSLYLLSASINLRNSQLSHIELLK